MSTNTNSALPVLVKDWKAFIEWAEDGGYSEAELNRWDFRSLVLQENYLEEGRARALELVKQDGLELEHLSVDMRTPQVCVAAVSQNPEAIKFMDIELVMIQPKLITF